MLTLNVGNMIVNQYNCLWAAFAALQRLR